MLFCIFVGKALAVVAVSTAGGVDAGMRTGGFEEESCFVKSAYYEGGKGIICDVLRDSVPFAQFKKGEKHPWKSVTFL